VLQTDGSVKRVQRAATLGSVKTITRQIARSVLNQKLESETHNQRWPKAVRSFSEFVDTEWRPNAALAAKKSTMKFYTFQLERHIVPVFGSRSLSEVNRNQIESLLSKLREKGHASGTLRGVRTTMRRKYRESALCVARPDLPLVAQENRPYTGLPRIWPMQALRTD
jgi:Phage integrase, N-terminal SAM-like domain